MSFCKKKGLHLIERNYKCLHGEIDLVMQDKKTIVFVEVRYRRNKSFGYATETVDYFKQQKLIRTAIYFLQTKDCLHHIDSRFDVVGLQNHPKYVIEWIKNAFLVFEDVL